MWEEFKLWFQSNNFPWFMLGFCLANVIYSPNILTLALAAFWIWVLTMDM